MVKLHRPELAHREPALLVAHRELARPRLAVVRRLAVDRPAVVRRLLQLIELILVLRLVRHRLRFP